jgi:glycine betaine/proline transport system permease protein
VRLPLALPTIMAGINQTIMMALAMVVVASMIGARGLGQEVLRALQRADVGRGLEAGLAIVFLAIIMDRVTAGYSRRSDPTRAPEPRIGRTVGPAARADSDRRSDLEMGPKGG